MIKKKLFKYGSVFMCAALMACSFAACGTNTSSAVQNEVAANEQDTDTETMIADVLTSQLSSAPKVATEAKTDSKEETVLYLQRLTDSRITLSSMKIKECNRKVFYYRCFKLIKHY